MSFTKEFKKHWVLYVCGIAIPFLIYCFFVFFPLFRSMYISLTKWDGLSDPVFIGLRNYSKLVKDSNFLHSLKNNIIWAVISLIIPVGGDLFVAIFLKSKYVYAGNIFRLLIFIPSTMSLAATAIIWSVILNPIFGGLNHLLTTLGLESFIHGWLDDPKIVIYVVAFVFSWNYLGMPMMMFHAGLGSINPELYEAADLEGASSLQKTFKITIPMLRSVITVVVLLVMINSLRAFDLISVMTLGGPGKSSNLLAFYMYTESFYKFNMGLGAAISVMILILSSAFSLLYMRKVTKDDNND